MERRREPHLGESLHRVQRTRAGPLPLYGSPADAKAAGGQSEPRPPERLPDRTNRSEDGRGCVDDCVTRCRLLRRLRGDPLGRGRGVLSLRAGKINAPGCRGVGIKPTYNEGRGCVGSDGGKKRVRSIYPGNIRQTRRGIETGSFP